MSTPQIQADISSTKADLAEAKSDGEFGRRDRLTTLLIEQQREENILLANETAASATAALLINWPKSPQKRNSVHIICCESNGIIDESGTAFAISGTKILTCYRNIATVDGAGNETAKFLNCVLVSFVDRDLPISGGIPVQYVDGNLDSDWAIFERSDGQTFPHFLSICTDLPRLSHDLPFTIYFAPLMALLVLTEVHVWSETTFLKQLDTIAPIAIFSGGRTSGCNGSPIVDGNGRVIAFLCSSVRKSFACDAATAAPPAKRATPQARIDRVEKRSADNENQHASYIRSLVICKIAGIMRHINPELI